MGLREPYVDPDRCRSMGVQKTYPTLGSQPEKGSVNPSSTLPGGHYSLYVIPPTRLALYQNNDVR